MVSSNAASKTRSLSDAERQLKREAAEKWRLNQRDAARWLMLERVRVNARTARTSVAVFAEEAAARQNDLGALSARVDECSSVVASLSRDWRTKLPLLGQRERLVRATAAMCKSQKRLEAYRREIDQFFDNRCLLELVLKAVNEASSPPPAAVPRKSTGVRYPTLTEVIDIDDARVSALQGL
jgi:hypothetical protein